MSNNRGLVAKMADRFNVDPDKMLSGLKATAFRSKEPITNEQMMALLVVADQYGLNPWTRELYAFPDKQNGIVPVVGVDGWSRIINSHPQFDGVEFEWAEEVVTPEGGKPCPAWCKAIIYRKDRTHPTAVPEYLDEVYRAPFKGQHGYISGPWQTHTKRFLRHKALIQAARIAFGFVGIFDEDEATRIVEGEATRNAGPSPPARPALPHLSDDEFERQLKTWSSAIESGRMDADRVIAMAGSRYVLTPQQRDRIRAASRPPEPQPEIDAEWVEQYDGQEDAA